MPVNPYGNPYALPTGANAVPGQPGNNPSYRAPAAPPAPAAPAASSSAPQTPGPFGTGTYIPPAYPINSGAITQSPQLDNLYSQLQNASSALQNRGPVNYNVTAPQSTAATGTAAQGTASTYSAPQGSASGYNAALGGASSIGQVGGNAALGSAAYADPTRISTAGDLAWQAQQQQLASILARQAAGGGMSPADLQLRAGTEQGLAAQLAALGSQRGSTNFALAQRSAADQAAAGQAQLNQQMGIQRANETIQAQQALGGVLGTARGQAQNYNVNQADLLQALRLQNAGFEQNTTLANQGAINTQTQQNVGLAQQANEFNAGNAQSMTLADMLARNNALQYNAGNSQQMDLANLLARGQSLQYNAGNTQAMTLADMLAQNQFGMMNVGNQQQTNLANTAIAGQYGLANQQAAMESQNQFYNTLLGLTGASTGIAQSDRAAQLANQQLGVQQNTALDQIAAEAYAASAQANANLSGGLIGAGGSIIGAGINQLGNSGGGNLSNMPGYSVNPTQGGATATDVIPTDTSSDENVKTGIEGGNPMLDSFLRQYREASSKNDPNIDPDSGLAFHVQRYGQALSGGSPGSHLGSQIGGALGGAAAGAAAGSIVPGIGTAIGGILGGFLGSAGGSAFDSGGSAGGVSSRIVSPATGLQKIGVTDDDMEALSDDNEKEAVMSGNRGLQAFLEQANAQTGAQNQQGSYNNAFMQNGAPPNPQVDRQMPPNVNAGYGQPSLMDLLSSGYGGGGLDTLGGYYGGGFSGGGITDMGGGYGAGITDPGSYQAGGVDRGATFTGPNGQTATPILNPTFNTAAGGAASPWMGNPALQLKSPPPAVGTPSPLAGVATPINNPAMNTAAGGAGGPATGNPALALKQAPSNQLAGPYTAFAPAAPIISNTQTTSPLLNPAVRLSDERSKVPDTQGLRDLLDGLEAHQYRYKDPSAPGAGAGTYVSPMAQELEQTDLGKNMVFEGPDGTKMVDYGKGFGTMLAGQAMLHQRVSDLEDILRRRAAA